MAEPTPLREPWEPVFWRPLSMAGSPCPVQAWLVHCEDLHWASAMTGPVGPWGGRHGPGWPWSMGCERATPGRGPGRFPGDRGPSVSAVALAGCPQCAEAETAGPQPGGSFPASCSQWSGAALALTECLPRLVTRKLPVHRLGAGLPDFQLTRSLGGKVWFVVSRQQETSRLPPGCELEGSPSPRGLGLQEGRERNEVHVCQARRALQAWLPSLCLQPPGFQTTQPPPLCLPEPSVAVGLGILEACFILRAPGFPLPGGSQMVWDCGCCCGRPGAGAPDSVPLVHQVVWQGAGGGRGRDGLGFRDAPPGREVWTVGPGGVNVSGTQEFWPGL